MAKFKEYKRKIRAHAAGKDMTRGNEYPSTDPRHWLWRRGYLEAFKDANGL